MRIAILLVLLMMAMPARADSVHGYCERGGKHLDFTDGIAFEDARDASGVVTTTIYLTAKALDRAALAKCAECAGKPGENTFMSPRRDVVEAQRSATAAGWMEIRHVGGEHGTTTIINMMYLAADGTLTGLDGGNGHVELLAGDARRVVGKVATTAGEAPMDETDMTCEVAFDLAVDWPKQR